ncbi:hypothetical protein A2239_03115 [Candidatus Uhrbacteria bacterium RIFOXYA2_FULL_40_9]|nr:MAG: hypothetical protein UT94_C0049G0006 [Candidatus Uhrbacteria bacterium GW2011_GWF2_40_263]OGL93269.1 MAG: hypothetical protein A2239_03115 [Candidatus Uhrbacteria bacterium RIFOXYA2_FULL_40_9]OGL97174.1 MAG: hypothetical protein A2332_00635 [Candidatus Uhrbacteria bacterium RIFOXYB2_FULL_41_18]HBK35069.1 TrpR, YerC/YecD [Candidatus Uhrbacteria bacterium]HCB55389.1 TrpR, YerC/YecD [Candidatus Uhrbacteria bacterium]
MPQWNTKKTEELLETILRLETLQEAKNFFRDLLTEKELSELGNRWKAAQMLFDNIPYKKIEKETGLSSATIARISTWLHKGMNGYTTQIYKLHHHHPSSESDVS